MNKFKAWMTQATTAQQQKLADMIGSSVPTLYQIGNQARGASAERGGQIEAATRKLAKDGLPVVTRGDVVPACAACEYFRKCKGEKP